MPPLKKNESKLGLIALVLLVLAAALWFFGRDCGSEPEEKAPEAQPEAPQREQFGAELEIPEAFSRLREIAFNLWWTWNPGAIDLFRRREVGKRLRRPTGRRHGHDRPVDGISHNFP